MRQQSHRKKWRRGYGNVKCEIVNRAGKEGPNETVAILDQSYYVHIYDMSVSKSVRILLHNATAGRGREQYWRWKPS